MIKPKISIIIPVYNEEKTIGQLLDKVRLIKLTKFSKEVIVVDDGSTDRSLLIIKKQLASILIVEHTQNLGKGAAIKTALKKATGDFVIVQDADLEYDPSNIQKLLNALIQKRGDVIFGARINKNPLLIYWIGNKFLTKITNFLYGSNITDMETCYKLISRDLLEKLEIKSNGFEIEAEITAKILKNGCKIYEVSIKTKSRTKKEGKKIGLSDGVFAFWTLLKYKFVN